MNEPGRFRARTVCAIYAGGQSRRFGTDKTQALLGGTSLIERAVRFARTQADRVLIVGPRGIGPSPLAHVADADFGQGPARALAGALVHAAGLDQADRLLTISVDCPFLPGDLGARLTTAVAHDAAMPAVAISGGRVHPTIALWPLAAQKDLTDKIRAGENRLEALLGADRAHARVHFGGFRLDDIEIDPFFNINTPDDLAVAEAVQEALDEQAGATA